MKLFENEKKQIIEIEEALRLSGGDFVYAPQFDEFHCGTFYILIAMQKNERMV